MTMIRMQKLLYAAFVGILGCPAYAQQTQILPDGTVMQGHLTASQPSGTIVLPTCTNCTLVAGSTDFSGAAAATATSAVALAFGKVYGKAPSCIVLDHTTPSGNALAVEPTTTGFTLGTTVNADKFSWICVGQPGN